MLTPESTHSPAVPSPIVAILLAAGVGRRYDPSGSRNKLLAQLDGRALAIRSAQTLLDAGLPVLAVLRDADSALQRQLANIGCFTTQADQADQGMGHSLAHGVKQAIDTFSPDAILVALADMPFLDSAIVAHVAQTIDADHAIVATTFRGKRGHPVGFWRSLFPQLCQLEGDRGAGPLLNTYPVHLIPAPNDAVLRDIDKPSDLPAGDGSSY